MTNCECEVEDGADVLAAEHECAVSTPGPAEQVPLLEVSGVSKRYGEVKALVDAQLVVRPGMVHALVGANGAGKSTLIKIMAGWTAPDSGSLRVDGTEVSIGSPQDASDLGLNFIHQELNLVPKFTVLQNMALGWAGASKRGFFDRRVAAARATDVLGQLGVSFGLNTQVENLSVNDRWMVSLGRSLMRDARMIAMDEPTASFTQEEVDRLFVIIRDLVQQGTSVLYISHRLEEVLALSDDVTVLRDGQFVGTYPVAGMTRSELTRHIVGRDVNAPASPVKIVPEARTVLTLDRVAGGRVRDVSMEVRAGEIVGLAGLVGAGRTELARLLLGADRQESGSMTLNGKDYRPKGPHAAIARGVALVPEERRSEALLADLSIAMNMCIATTKSDRWRRTPYLLASRSDKRVAEFTKRFGIKMGSPQARVNTLSGGNQQKVIISRFLAAGPSVLILDEPTVGVDIGAREEIYGMIREFAAAGTAVILISSDFDELAFCHRVGVMREGRLEHMVDASDATKEHLTTLCYQPQTA